MFPKRRFDVSAAAAGLADAARQLDLRDRQVVVLTYDVAYAHAIDDVYARLQSEWEHTIPLVLSRIEGGLNFDSRVASRRPSKPCGQCASCDCVSRQHAPVPDEPCDVSSSPLLGARHVPWPPGTDLASSAVLYLGGESRALTHLLLTLGPSHPASSYDPVHQRARLETGQTNRLLMRRYATIQKARDASVVGLVIGTLGIHAYLPLLQQLRHLLTSAASRRKVYTISVGKLNPAKLANFQEIDVFVLLACAENSLLDTREFMRPVVTPWEMILAVQARGGNEVAWTGAYELDFARVLQDTKSMNVDEPTDDDDRPHYSFATGTYVSRTRYGEDLDAQDTQESTSRALESLSIQPHELSVRDPTSGQLIKVLDSAALARRGERTWHGLDPNEGQAHAAVLEQGLEGFAQSYRAADGTREGDSLSSW